MTTMYVLFTLTPYQVRDRLYASPLKGEELFEKGSFLFVSFRVRMTNGGNVKSLPSLRFFASLQNDRRNKIATSLHSSQLQTTTKKGTAPKRGGSFNFNQQYDQKL
ncbi:MAG: hypothetical protein Q7J73_04680 [Dehalococcoidales bacterium]|nr:hypothetical protein [Dehalococcoidales bacterium]